MIFFKLYFFIFKMKLYVKILNDDDKVLYNETKNYKSDSGFDLFFTKDVVVPKNAIGFKIPLGVSCAPDGNHGYYLYPRSSIVKTPLRLCNSVGIIDKGYRGEICAFVDNLSEVDVTLERGKSLFQLCAPDLSPLDIEFVKELDKTERGEGGFGSTH